MIPLFLLFDRAALEPGDLLDLLAARSGHAFLPETQRPFRWSLRTRKPDEVVLANWARNHWDLKVAGKGGFAAGTTVPLDRLFDANPADEPRPSAKRPRARWLDRNGTIATVADLFAAGNLPIERCHWAYRERRLLVRFDPDRLESGLPDLASALGARYDEGSRAIVFSARDFREHVRNSIPESVLESPKHATLALALARIGISNASDGDLDTLFSKPINFTNIPLTSLTRKEREVVARYVSTSVKLMTDSGGGMIDELRSRVDLESLPSIKVTTSGAGCLRFIGRDGKMKVEF